MRACTRGQKTKTPPRQSSTSYPSMMIKGKMMTIIIIIIIIRYIRPQRRLGVDQTLMFIHHSPTVISAHPLFFFFFLDATQSVSDCSLPFVGLVGRQTAEWSSCRRHSLNCALLLISTDDKIRNLNPARPQWQNRKQPWLLADARQQIGQHGLAPWEPPHDTCILFIFIFSFLLFFLRCKPLLQKTLITFWVFRRRFPGLAGGIWGKSTRGRARPRSALVPTFSRAVWSVCQSGKDGGGPSTCQASRAGKEE